MLIKHPLFIARKMCWLVYFSDRLKMKMASKENLCITTETDLLYEKAPQCLECIHNTVGDGLCYRNNDGKGIAQLKTPCASRDILHNCATCNKSVEHLKGKRYPDSTECKREKRVGIGLCRGDWVISPYFDLSDRSKK